MSEVQMITNKIATSVLPLINQEEEVIVIHSALSKLGFPRGENYIKGLMDFLEILLVKGKTILLPSFTFSYSKGHKFNLNNSPSETGKLADFARKRLQFTRTHNPMYSFTLKGPLESEFLSARSDIGYGEGTVIEKLINKNVAIVMLGADWGSCSAIHTIEERMNVPYREYMEWNYPVDYGQGWISHPFRLFVRKSEHKNILRFDRIRGDLERTGELRQSKLNGKLIEAANGLKVGTIAENNIKTNPLYYIQRETNNHD